MVLVDIRAVEVVISAVSPTLGTKNVRTGSMWRMSKYESDMTHLDMALQQQLQDMLYYVQSEWHLKMVPRVCGVRFTRPSSTIDYSICVHFHIMKQESGECIDGEFPRIELAARIPSSFPIETPVIVCVTGAESVPKSLVDGSELRLPSLSGGWPMGYSLSLMTRDLCVAIGGSDPPNLLAGTQVLPAEPSAPALDPYEAECHEAQVWPESIIQSSQFADADGLVVDCTLRGVQRAIPYSKRDNLNSLMSAVRQCFSVDAAMQITLKSTLDQLPIDSDTRLSQLCAWSNGGKLVVEVEVHVKTEDLLGFESPTKDAKLINVVRPKTPQAVASPMAKARPPTPSKDTPAVQTTSTHTSVSVGNIRHIAWSSICLEHSEVGSQELQLGKCVGVGSSCRVYHAVWRGTEVAVKNFTGTNRQAVEKEFSNEVKMMAMLGAHPSLVLFLAVSRNPLSIVFEYLPFSLFDARWYRLVAIPHKNLGVLESVSLSTVPKIRKKSSFHSQLPGRSE
ncbi:TPA: LOW QUALITY PROTEIN: hypothetical protein N0F65_005962 [Lagenidium giganteum]|uniref:Serine-threonine/tyrosine-protein kinase catalytic domain-containing protein n=1 Tax=Lagenidium giganteum TaxID=4803 RepID=A0AAV2ZAM2_9STRA|nr:TPA: LOW QUALITY PROTEIN: hypothetical protein N0F65_005962 [Lagenidium giganteum]